MFRHQIPAVLAGLALTGQLLGSTVASVSVAELVHASALVFEGRVIGREVFRDGASGDLFTKVTFEIEEVLKGGYADPTISLHFLGGTLGTLTLAIGDVRIPKSQEYGIYFVDSLKDRYVHPLYGWDQGRFLILNDLAGHQRIHTADGKPVLGVAGTGPVLKPGLDGQATVALGVSVAENGSGNTGLTPAEFKRRVREIGGLQ